MGREENKVQKAGLEYINSNGYLADRNMPIRGGKLFRVNSKGIRGRKSTLPDGFSDLAGYVIIKRFLTIPVYAEAKAPEEECKNPDQLKFIRERREDGAIAFWFNSLNDFKYKLYHEIIRVKKLFEV